jgi:N-acetylneuraminic acid mutarotase
MTWTGSKLVVWGGYDGVNALNTGGQFDPITNSWTSTTTTGAPEGRNTFAMVWTGSKVLIWGGCTARTGAGSCKTSVNTGGQYDPSTNSWTTMTTTNAPSKRYWATGCGRALKWWFGAARPVAA